MGLALAALQTTLALGTAGTLPVREAYLHLSRWDSGWYADIIDNGYLTEIPPKPEGISNVAFFPGFPLGARLLKDFLGLSTGVAMPLTAQLACWGFWTYLLLMWQRWRTPPRLAAAGTLAILVHPAAFFLVCGYSESLFLLMTVGFLYWARTSGRLGFPLAVLHGCIMTATRLVGVPLAAVPLFAGLLPGAAPGGRLRRLIVLALLGVLASLGAGLFFAWCHHRFGHWDLYQQTQAIGWNIHPNYLAIADWHSYAVKRWREWSTPFFWSRLTVPLTAVLLLALLWRERGQPGGRFLPGRRMRLGLYFGAFFIFYISVSAMSGRNLDSMVRHHLAVHVLLVLAAVHLFTVAPERMPRHRLWWLVPAAAAFAIQCYFAYRFTHGEWVA
jgi:hypothetical protein